MLPVCRPAFWNVFPFHPWVPGNPTKNRAPTAAETEIGLRCLDGVVKILRPHMIVAVGRVANDLLQARYPTLPDSSFSHPSMGGYPVSWRDSLAWRLRKDCVAVGAEGCHAAGNGESIPWPHRGIIAHMTRIVLSRIRRSVAIVIAWGLLVTSSIEGRAGLHSGPEYDVLVELYISTSGGMWTNSQGWGVDDACHWYGVECDQDTSASDNTSHVTRIGLSNNNLTGIIPALSGLGDHIVAISLSENNLTGSIPALTGLTGLQVFYVDGNQLTGSIPTLSGLTNLQYFWVNSNQLSGPIPSLTGLANLQYFWVFENQLSGSIPCLSAISPCSSGLTYLASFLADNNLLIDAIPDLAGLTNLEAFSVARNQLTGVIPQLSGLLLVNLDYFDVDSNQLTGPIPDIATLPALTNFYVAANRLSGAVPTAPASLSDATLCPNLLDTTPQPSIDPAWDTATGRTPWWAVPHATNECDETFANGFE